jgi:hypothetical protein
MAQFEEPLFRKVEEAPAFYNDHVVKFCREGYAQGWMFEGLERPYEIATDDVVSGSQSLDADTGGIAPTISTGASLSSNNRQDDIKLNLPPRVFWISRLVMQLANDSGIVTDENYILRHLAHTGKITKAPNA